MKTTHIIIGGTTKSATTSLFKYLADHPLICGSSMKETRFFLDSTYPLESKLRLQKTIAPYYTFFRHRKQEEFLLEASPDYLYAHETPINIHHHLSPVKIIFILRDPVQRFLSWYQFSKQNGTIPNTTTLAEYLAMQTNDGTGAQHVRVLHQGLYSHYLQKYFNLFHSQDIYICFMEDLSRDPESFIHQLCHYIGIDSSFYEGYSFERLNPTMGVKNQALHQQYTRWSFLIRKQTHHIPLIHQTLKSIKRIFHPLYIRLNKTQTTSQNTADPTITQLEKFYANERVLYNGRYKSFNP